MSNLQNNFTTPEQSKRLLELGVPIWTADCFRWDYRNSFGISEDNRYSTSISVICFGYQRGFNDKFPCWSVGRLMEIFAICFDPDFIEFDIFADGTTFLQQMIDKFETCIDAMDFSKLEK